MALENCLHVRFVAFQEERAHADGALGLLQAAELLHDIAGDELHRLRCDQHVLFVVTNFCNGDVS